MCVTLFLDHVRSVREMKEGGREGERERGVNNPLKGLGSYVQNWSTVLFHMEAVTEFLNRKVWRQKSSVPISLSALSRVK